jgi:hypothetical protein
MEHDDALDVLLANPFECGFRVLSRENLYVFGLYPHALRGIHRGPVFGLFAGMLGVGKDRHAAYRRGDFLHHFEPPGRAKVSAMPATTGSPLNATTRTSTPMAFAPV